MFTLEAKRKTLYAVFLEFRGNSRWQWVCGVTSGPFETAIDGTFQLGNPAKKRPSRELLTFIRSSRTNKGKGIYPQIMQSEKLVYLGFHEG